MQALSERLAALGLTEHQVTEAIQAIEEAIAPPGKLVPYTRKQDTFAHGYNAALAEIKKILRS